MSIINNLQQKIAKFIEQRDWETFHTPKNLAMSIAIEAAELMELFQWITIEESIKIIEQDEEMRDNIADEVADILIYLLSFANITKIDLESAVLEKIRKNEQRFPIELMDK